MKMENQFTKIMSESSDEKLITILTTERESYNPEAIKAAELEIEKRNIIIDKSKIIENKDKNSFQKKESKLTHKRKLFNEKFLELTESEYQKEILFTQRLALEKLEKIRENTSKLVWFLIVIPIVVGLLFILLNK